MTRSAAAGLALLLLTAAAQPACAPAVRTSAAAPEPEVVRVAPPTGEREADRASILAALERVRPGGTVQFAPGTYLVGKLLRVGVPHITLLGHPDSTTMRGCDPTEYLEQAVVLFTCAGFELSAGHQTVRNLTFEYTSHGLFVGCCWFDDPDDAESGEGRQPRLVQPGGHLIEGNTFRFASNPIRVIGASAEPILIRGNRFVNSYHVFSVAGGAVHFLDNDVTVPEPGRVPVAGHPGGAVAIMPFGSMLSPWNRSADEDTSCAHNVIAGNRIEGHPDAIDIGAHAGSSCRHNVIRDNTLIVRPATAADTLRIIGVPLAIRSTDGGLTEDNHIEGNRIAGAEGLGIEVLRASRNRISNNTITGISRRDPFPGSAYWRDVSAWREGNGAGIWISAGSDENEITGNTFEDIAAHAIVLEGHSNRVQTGSASDAVRDLGFGNRVSAGADAVRDVSDATSSRFFHSDGLRLHYLDFGGEGLPLLFVPALGRTADTFSDFAPRFTDRHHVLAITNRGSGQSQGETRDQWDTAGKARDVVALLDTLGIQRAVVVGRWEDVPIYLAENHADRLAGIVILSPEGIGPSRQTLRAQDPTGVTGMVDRWALTAVWDLDPDQPAPWDDEFEPRYVQTGEAVAVPTLVFRGAESGGRGAADPTVVFQLAELEHVDPESFPDTVARSYFHRLRADSTLRAEVQAFHENVVGPAFEASEGAFMHAFGAQFRIVRLDLDEPITGYEYRDQPALFEADIRSFLEEIIVLYRGGNQVIRTDADEIAALTARFVELLNDEWSGGASTLFASDATMSLGDGILLEGRDAIVRDFFRPAVARIRGLVPTSSEVIEGEQRVTVVTTYSARLAPAPDTVQGSFSNTWARQPDGSWLIATATFDLPGWQDDGASAAGIRSGFFKADGLRLHYLDSGGDGVPLLFMPVRDRTAYSFIEFAERFTDRHRVLAITSRGTGKSEGELDDVFSVANAARDVVALLDALGIERAVVVPAWSADIGIILGNLHPDRLAGLIFSNGPPTPDLFELLDADSTGVLAMAPRLFFALDGLDPDESLRQMRVRQEEAAPYRRLDAPIRVPALVFVGEMGTADVEGQWETELGRARWVADDPGMFGDTVSREFYLKLASDERLQESVRVLYRDFVAPRYRAVEQAFASVFGSCLRLARVEAKRMGYAYRDAPDMIYPHIRRFLDDVNAFEGCAVSTEVDTIHVAAPTGRREADRASILAALEQVSPGGTIQFAPGTYAVGELIPVATPRMTLLSHPQGTTLRGCEPTEYDAMAVEGQRATDYREHWAIVSRCGMFEMTGGHGTIRGLTFEYTMLGLILGCCYAEGAFRPSEGGYLVEGNTFRDSGNGVRPVLSAADVTLIRNNRFINTFHAVSAVGSRIHVTDNEISVPEPRRVPGRGHPGFGIGFSPGPALPMCEENIVADNRIEGHETGIVLFADPDSICRANIIRDNTIIVRGVPLPAAGVSRDAVDITAEADSTIVGVPVTLHNPTGEGRLERNVIEGNRILGAAGIGIEVLHASMNRIIGNTIMDVARRDPFPGNTLGGDPQRWELANGSGIWVSRGSDENEILGNIFGDVASHAVVLEGASNRVETQSTNDAVRDLGTGNQVAVRTHVPAGTDASAGPAGTRNPEVEVRAATYLFIAALNDELPEQLVPFYAADATKTLTGGTVLEGRNAIVETFIRPVVARIRGLRAVSEPTVRQEWEGRVTVEGTFALRWAPAQDTVEFALSNTWTRQPDGRWLITGGTFGLPHGSGVENLNHAEGSDDDAVRSRFFHNEDRRLHYLDFGGEGLPILFVPAMDRTAYTFLDFAPRFTDGHRVLAITNGGSGQSEGRTTDLWDRERQARDVVAMLDTLGIPRAVIVGRWPNVPIQLAENHGDRVAGLVILSPDNMGPAWRALRTKDSTGVLEMVDRWGLAARGLDPGQPAPWHDEYEPRYLRSGGAIGVPALAFRGVAASGKGAADLTLWLELAELAVADPETFPDSVSRSWFQRLSADAGLRAEVRAFYEDIVDPAFEASERAFRDAFGDHLRLVRLDLEGPITGYAYRDHPERFELHIHRFLDDIQKREYR